MIRINPLHPRIPSAPPWDEDATAKGVYITNQIEIAMDYAETCADDDGSIPLIIEIDISNKSIQIDPQAIDLLLEPYHLHRQEILTKAIRKYNEPILEMRQSAPGMSKDERKAAYRAIREKQGPVFEFVIKFLTDPKNAITKLPSVRIQFPSLSGTGMALDKRGAANIIFPEGHTWDLIHSMHDFYKEKAPKIILKYMDLQSDDEESIYSSQSVYINSKHPDFDVEFWYYLSSFAYLDTMVPDEDISAIYRLENRKPILIYKRNIPAARGAYHGSCVGRVGGALKNLL